MQLIPDLTGYRSESTALVIIHSDSFLAAQDRRRKEG
jgi:hypothetical protein